MIDIQGLSQSYKRKLVLDDVELHVAPREICALVGRNGAGKSTLIHSILGILPVAKGSIRVAGIPVEQQQWKKNVAYLPEKFQLYPQLTAEENMRFFASLDEEPDEKRIEDCLSKVHLWDVRHERISGFSKGMLQRLGLGIMLYYPADLLILDEPTSGLDPMGRSEILSILKSLKDKTILFSSHHMDEIRQICTHVAYVENQKITKHTIEAFAYHFLQGGISS